jgi:hypothetical protein
MLHFTTSEMLRVLLELSTERWRSPAAESGSGAGASGSQVQRFVRWWVWVFERVGSTSPPDWVRR